MFDETILCTVVMCAPETGCAVVVENGKSQSLANALIGLLPYSDTRTGSAPYMACTNGTTVLCRRLYGKGSRIVGIVGYVNSNMDLLGNAYAHRRIYDLARCTQSWSKMLSNWKLMSKLMAGPLAAFFKSHANVVDGDMLPGDYDIQDKYASSGLHTGMLVTSMRGSAFAMMDATVPDSKLRRFGDVLSDNTLAHETMAAYDYMVHNTALNASEAFGLRSGPVMKRDGNNLVPVNDAAIPLYRMQHMEGAPIGGVEDNILDFPYEKDTHLPDKDSEPAVLSVQRRGLSGSLLSASTLCLSSVKTPGVVGALQLGYGKKPLQPGVKPTADGYGLQDMTDMDDLREPYEEPQKEVELEGATGVSDEDKATDAALNKLMDTLLEGEYRQKILDIMAARGFSKASREHSIRSRMPGEAHGTETPGGMTPYQHYDLPGYVDIEDPVTGEKRRYYNSMSFITQEPDGSICISDGYGSEIRMCRGNIYISSALDTFIRPGRNMCAMTPGTQTFNSQGRCDISSGKDTVSVRAVKDLCMAAGAGDNDEAQGRLVIENLTRSGGDILITGKGNTALTAGRNLVLGTRTGADSCNVTIDAGLSGAAYIRGAAATVESRETVIGGFQTQGDSASGTAMVVNSSTISLLADTVSVPADILMQKPKSTPKVMVLRDGKTVSAGVKYRPSGSLSVSGSVLVGGQLKVNMGIDTVSVMADSQLGVHPQNSPYKAVEFKDNAGIPAEAGAGPANAGREQEQEYGMHSSKYLADNTFKYPEDYGVDMEVVPGMRWQEASRDSGNPGDMWTEPEVNKTSIYPGKPVWDNARVSGRGYDKSAMLKSGYRTNAKTT